MRMLLLLIAVAVASALGVVYMKHRTRMLYADVQQLQQAVDALEEDWVLLQLEQKTCAEHSLIERTAVARLRMVLPSRESTIYLQP